MAERDPIDLIREQLSAMERLAGLSANHEVFMKWHDETKTILDKAFSSKSIHYQSFLALRFREMTMTPFASHEIDRINAARYKRDLDNAKNILQGAIKELTLDRTLFKKIQTTPKSVEFTLKGEYYLSSGFDYPELVQAIQSAFEGSGLTFVRGADLPLPQRIEQIKQAQFGIYELSNPQNVDSFLELGAALGLGKRVVIILKKGSQLPDAVRSLDLIEYEDLSFLDEQLKKVIKL